MTMKYWWVNHGMTYDEEHSGGFIWSPQKTKRGPIQGYTNLTLVSPGDVVLSYANKSIQAVGVVTAKYTPADRPRYSKEGTDLWAVDGWRVPIEWTVLEEPLTLEGIKDKVSQLLPSKHSPLNRDFKANLNGYLSEISRELYYLVLAEIQDKESDSYIEDEIFAEQEELRIRSSSLPEEEKRILCLARNGQGKYKNNLINTEKGCRLTGVTDRRVLIASHAKPWAKCANKEEQLDGNNGLLLAPHVDFLFDRFLISFEDDGSMITAGPAVDKILKSWNINPNLKTKDFSAAQIPYITYHRVRHLQVKAKGKWA